MPVAADVESWAEAYVLAESLEHKLAPPAPPTRWAADWPRAAPTAPGRPSELRPARRGSRVPARLESASARAKLLHAFLHHELQAAELACWALLSFPRAEPEFRRGLLRICLDEIRHLNGYRALIERLGHCTGDFPVRDWFWKRVPSCRSPLQFVALMGMGLEGANLDHGPEFEARFRAVGDVEAADFQRLVAREERSHVAFAVRFFERWTGGQSFERWQAELPPPLSPLMMRGKRCAANDRRAAGMSPEFVEALFGYRP